MIALTRRRFLAISAASAALPAQAKTPPTATWRGIALGAPASLRIAGLEQAQAQPMIAAVEAELARLEMIFSLYREESEIRRLNSQGSLHAPSPELLEVLSLADAIHRATNGAFDPSIQPLWLAEAIGEQAPVERAASHWQHLRFDSREVHFAPPVQTSMALSLNGIAQGAITDRIVTLLRSFGLENIMVDMGEIVARGEAAPGAAWQAAVADPEGQILDRVTLSDRALATSAPYVPDHSGHKKRHILPPTSGHQIHQKLVAVSAPTAVVADGLSTALCLLNSAEISDALAQFPDARVEVVQPLT